MPFCEEYDQPVSLGCQMVLSVLPGTKHLTLGEDSAGVNKEVALTAIASSVTNITSTGHEDALDTDTELSSTTGFPDTR